MFGNTNMNWSAWIFPNIAIVLPPGGTIFSNAFPWFKVCVENPDSGVEAKEPLFCEPRSSLLSKSYWHTRLICPLILSTRSGQISGEISPAAAGRSKNFPHPSTQKPLFVASPVQQIFCQWTEWLDSNDRWSWRGLCRLPPIPSRHTFELRIWSISIQDQKPP